MKTEISKHMCSVTWENGGQETGVTGADNSGLRDLILFSVIQLPILSWNVYPYSSYNLIIN